MPSACGDDPMSSTEVERKSERVNERPGGDSGEARLHDGGAVAGGEPGPEVPGEGAQRHLRQPLGLLLRQLAVAAGGKIADEHEHCCTRCIPGAVVVGFRLLDVRATGCCKPRMTHCCRNNDEQVV